MTENALPDLGVADGFADGHRNNFVRGVLSPFFRCSTTDETLPKKTRYTLT
jgi:hypothetical protein